MKALKELTERDQWVAHTSSKIPIAPNGDAASSTNPKTWGSLSDAKIIKQMRGLPGVGYVLAEDDPFVCIDLDNVIEPETGELRPWAAKIVRGFNTYTEVSPGGLGLHIWLRGKTPRAGMRRSDKGRKIEVYGWRRYITMTGKSWAGTPDAIEERQVELNRLWTWLERRQTADDIAQMDKPLPHTWEAPEDEQWLGEALRWIPADDYALWVRVGHALQSSLGERGWPIWDAWSSSSSKYGGTHQTRKKWEQLQADGSVNLGTIAWLAERRGYELPRERAPAAFERGWDSWFDEQENPVVDGASTEGLSPMWFDFAAAYRDTTPPEPSIVEPRVLGRGDLLVLAGPPKAGKSLVCLDMCRQWALGEPWLFTRPARPLTIAYMQFELRADAVRERIQMRKLTDEQVEQLAGRFFFTSRMTAALTPSFVTMCVESIRDAMPAAPDVLVIDPLANLFAGDSESSNAEMMEFVRNLKVLRNHIDPDCAIVLVHHSRKGDRQDRHADPFDSIRGGSALRGAYDAGMLLDRTGIEVDSPNRLFTELRNGPRVEAKTIKFVDGRWIDLDRYEQIDEVAEVQADGAAVVNGQPTRPAEHRDIEQRIRDEGLMSRLYTESAFARAFDGRGMGSESTIRRKVKALAHQGWIAYARSVGPFVAPSDSPGFLVVRQMHAVNEETGEAFMAEPTSAVDPSTGEVVAIEDGWSDVRPAIV